MKTHAEMAPTAALEPSVGDVPGWVIGVPRSGLAEAPQDRNDTMHVLSDGMLTGVLGYATLAGFFAVVSMLQGRSPFHIAALLAAALFGAPAGGAGAVEAGPVLAYNGIHLLVLMLAGIGLAALARVAASTVQGWYLAFMAVLFVGAHIIGLPIWFGEHVSAELPLWLVVTATALTVAVMSGYLWSANPDIAAAMHEPDE